MDELLLDTSGALCPWPIIEAAKAMRGLAPGAVLRLVATDPAFERDLPAWCQSTGNLLLSLERQGPAWVGRVRKGSS